LYQFWLVLHFFAWASISGCRHLRPLTDRGVRLELFNVKKIIQLSEPKLTGPVSLEEALARRRSVRSFTGEALDFVQIGQLAWAGQGITDKKTGFRTAPSAGAIYPIELYFATHDGLFVYHPDTHSLEEVFSRDVLGELAGAALRQTAVADAPCDIIVAGSQRKLAAKYGSKARRYMLLEAGHIAQNIQLQAVSLGLGSVTVGAFEVRRVNNICKLPTALESLYIICVGSPAGRAGIETAAEGTKIWAPANASTKTAVLIIASGKFRDEELFETKRQLERAGIKTIVASSRTGAIKGMLGGRAEAAIAVSRLRVDDYDAIIFIGGTGAVEYFDSPVALSIANQAVYKKKVLAAICIAPSILANAGVLYGVKVTSFPSEQTRLENAGARYTGAAVERDGLIITASGPTAASEFGKAIADTITGKPQQN